MKAAAGCLLLAAFLLQKKPLPEVPPTGGAQWSVIYKSLPLFNHITLP